MKKYLSNLTKILLSLLIVAMGLVTPAALHAQQGTDNLTPETQGLETRQIKGRVTRIEERMLVIETDEGVREVKVPEGVRVTRNSLSASLQELAVDDQVTVTVDQNGRVLDVNATAGLLADASDLFIPALILLAVILLIAIILFSKAAGNNKIKTTTTKVDNNP